MKINVKNTFLLKDEYYQYITVSFITHTELKTDNSTKTRKRERKTNIIRISNYIQNGKI